MSKRLLFIAALLVFVVGTVIYAQPAPKFEDLTSPSEKLILQDKIDAPSHDEWGRYHCHSNHYRTGQGKMMSHHLMGRWRR